MDVFLRVHKPNANQENPRAFIPPFGPLFSTTAPQLCSDMFMLQVHWPFIIWYWWRQLATGRGLKFASCREVHTKKRPNVDETKGSAAVLGAVKGVLSDKEFEHYWSRSLPRITWWSESAWSNYFWPTGHHKKRDNLRATSNKMMYNATDSQYLKLKKVR